jgi:hypothetical protein
MFETIVGTLVPVALSFCWGTLQDTATLLA